MYLYNFTILKLYNNSVIVSKLQIFVFNVPLENNLIMTGYFEID